MLWLCLDSRTLDPGCTACGQKFLIFRSDQDVLEMDLGFLRTLLPIRRRARERCDSSLLLVSERSVRPLSRQGDGSSAAARGCQPRRDTDLQVCIDRLMKSVCIKT